jgi:hypothetical protein
MHTPIRIAQKMPAEYKTKILQFHKFIIAARNKLCFELGQIGKMDKLNTFHAMLCIRAKYKDG